MSIYTYSPAPGYSSSQKGIVNAGGGVAFDVGAALVAGGGQFTVDSVQNTTLDDVFVHYTGRQLRDEQVKAYQFVMPDRPGMRP